MSVQVEIGAKTTGFSTGLAHMQNEFAGFKHKLSRKFSFADAGKGLLMGLGIGSVDQIASTFTGMFQTAADSAKLMQERTAATLQTTLALIGLKQNPAQQIASNVKEMHGQEVMMERQKQLVDELNASPLKFVSSEHRQQLAEAERDLAHMEQQLGQMQVSTEQLRIAEKKRQQGLRDSGQSIEDERSQLRGLIDDVEVARRARERAARHVAETAGLPGNEEALLALQQASFNLEKAKKARELAQIKGIVADPLAKIGGGGGIFAPSSMATTNPAQALVTEAQKHTTLLGSIDKKITVKFTTSAVSLGLK